MGFVGGRVNAGDVDKNGYRNPMLPLAVVKGGVKSMLKMREWHLLGGR